MDVQGHRPQHLPPLEHQRLRANVLSTLPLTPEIGKWWMFFRPFVGTVLPFENNCLAQRIDFWKPLPRLWCGNIVPETRNRKMVDRWLIWQVLHRGCHQPPEVNYLPHFKNDDFPRGPSPFEPFALECENPKNMFPLTSDPFGRFHFSRRFWISHHALSKPTR